MRTKKSIWTFVVVTLAAVLIVGAFKNGITQSPPPCPTEFVTRLQAGVGTEAPCPTNLGTISFAVANCAFFMQYRCALSLSNTAQQRLTQLEQETWPGNCNGVCQLTRQQVKDIVTASLINVVTHLSDAQINSMATGSFQMMPCWTPPNRGHEVLLETSGQSLTPTAFVQMAQGVRNGDPTLQSQFGSEIAGEVDRYCNILAYAIPTQWNVTSYDPYRAFMLAYYVVSQDNLADNSSTVSSFMTNMQGYLSQQGFNCPTTGKAMWGDAGYGYSRPVSTIFSDSVQLDLLNRYAAVHGLQ